MCVRPGRNTNSGFTGRKLYEYPFPVMIRTPYYLVYLDLKSSRNKKDLNDVPAAPFSVTFSHLPAAKKSQKWGSCGVIKVFLTLWQLQLLKGFFYYNLSIESDTSADKVLLKERAFEHLPQKV